MKKTRLEGMVIRTATLSLLLAITLGVFWNALGSPFQFDDHLFLQSPQITEPGDAWYLLRPGRLRQLTNLSFYWNYRWGGASPKGFHAVNLFLHLLSVSALYWLVRNFATLNFGVGREFLHAWLPGLSAGIFALHPVQSEAVNYIYQRSTLLAGLFCLVSMAAWFKSQVPKTPHRWRVISWACYLLAIASKESAVVLPLAWLAWHWANARDWRDFLSRIRTSRPGTRILAAGLPLVLTLGLLFARGGETGIGNSLQYLLAQIQVIPTYLRILLLPVGLSIDHDFRPTPALSPYALYCMLVLSSLGALAIRFRKRNPSVSFWIAAFFIFLLPTSSIIPSRDLLFEHRLYLPMAAAAILMAWAFLAVLSELKLPVRYRALLMTALSLTLLSSYARMSWQRTYLWGDNIRLWSDAVSHAPGKARPHYNLGVAFLERNREKAKTEFLRALEIDPEYAAASYNLGWIAQSEGNYESAADYYRATLKSDTTNWQAHHNLGNIAIVRGRLRDAVDEFQETIRRNRQYWPAYLSLAGLQMRQGDTAGGLKTLQALMEFRWDLLEARFMRATGMIAQSRILEAENEMRFITEHDTSGLYRSRILELRRSLKSRSEDSK
jgi:tetratricopeptide (TPR) repeat protein